MEQFVRQIDSMSETRLFSLNLTTHCQAMRLYGND